MANMRVCRACGKEYEYCPNCGKYNLSEKWRVLFCSEECRDVFDVISSYNMGMTNKEGVQRILTKYHCNDTDKFVPSIQNKIKGIIPRNENKVRAYKEPKYSFGKKQEIETLGADIDLNE